VTNQYTQLLTAISHLAA